MLRTASGTQRVLRTGTDHSHHHGQGVPRTATPRPFPSRVSIHPSSTAILGGQSPRGNKLLSCLQQGRSTDRQQAAQAVWTGRGSSGTVLPVLVSMSLQTCHSCATCSISGVSVYHLCYQQPAHFLNIPLYKRKPYITTNMERWQSMRRKEIHNGNRTLLSSSEKLLLLKILSPRLAFSFFAEATGHPMCLGSSIKDIIAQN